MSGRWDGPPLPMSVAEHFFTKYGRLTNKLRRVVIEDYFIEHESWGSAVRPKYKLTITIDGEGPFPAWTSIPGPWYERPKHTCPLTEAKPGEIMMYACPVCSGATC